MNNVEEAEKWLSDHAVGYGSQNNEYYTKIFDSDFIRLYEDMKHKQTDEK